TWLRQYMNSRPSLSCCPPPLSFGDCSITAVDNNEDNTSVYSVYPNPFNSNITVNMESDFTYTITDLLGNSIESGTGNNQKDIADNLLPGVYMLRINNGITTKSFKITKTSN